MDEMRTIFLLLSVVLLLAGWTKSSYHGQVSEERQTKGGLIIDTDGTYPNQAMTLYIPQKDEANFAAGFPNIGDTISVAGRKSDHRGRPEIIVTSPSQITP